MSDSTGSPLQLLEEAVRRLGRLVPSEAVTHFTNAQREMVLGLTALIEHRGKPAPTPTRPRRAPTAAARARRPRRVTVD